MLAYPMEENVRERRPKDDEQTNLSAPVFELRVPEPNQPTPSTTKQAMDEEKANRQTHMSAPIMHAIKC